MFAGVSSLRQHDKETQPKKLTEKAKQQRAYLAAQYGPQSEDTLGTAGVDDGGIAKKKKKKKKATSGKERTNLGGITIVDEDRSGLDTFSLKDTGEKQERDVSRFDENEEDEEAPLIANIEEAAVLKKQVERQREILEKGHDSGWSIIEEQNNRNRALKPLEVDRNSISPDASPPRRRGSWGNPDIDASPPRGRGSQGSPSFNIYLDSKRKSQNSLEDRSPPRRERTHRSFDASPPPRGREQHKISEEDASPPRRKTTHESSDASPPRRIIDHDISEEDASPPRRRTRRRSPDASPPRRRVKHDVSEEDASPPRRRTTRRSLDASPARRRVKHDISEEDASPPRRRTTRKSPDASPPRKRSYNIPRDNSLSPAKRTEYEGNVSSPSRKRHRDEEINGAFVGMKTGKLSGKELMEDIIRKKEYEAKRFAELGSDVTGKGAETIYRDASGRRVTAKELQEIRAEQKRGRAKPTYDDQSQLEWGGGLAQKQRNELELKRIREESSKAFGRSFDEDYDAERREQTRWGDPMAHLVKSKADSGHEVGLEAAASRRPLSSQLENLERPEFRIPSEVPPHSWLRRRVHPPANRYGIKPGRHWDGVDRSNGFEQDLFKRQNELKMRQQEAAMWAQSDL